MACSGDDSTHCVCAGAAGRAARQGDPGSVETWLSLDTALLAQFWPAWVRGALKPLAPALPPRAVRLLARLPKASLSA